MSPHGPGSNAPGAALGPAGPGTAAASRLSEAEFDRIAKALADPQRCEILQRTANAGELCCSKIVAACAVSQATISHHLKELATAGLLERRKDGQFAYYSFKREVMSAYLDELSTRMLLPAGKRKPVRR